MNFEHKKIPRVWKKLDVDIIIGTQVNPVSLNHTCEIYYQLFSHGSCEMTMSNDRNELMERSQQWGALIALRGESC